MRTYVLLDIDGVLLPWVYKDMHTLRADTGWYDFTRQGHLSMKVASKSLLDAVWDAFGRDAVWLTTWEIGYLSIGANKNFADFFGLPHLKTIPFIKERYAEMANGKGTVLAPDGTIHTWWKSYFVADFLREIEKESDEPYKLLWIDDDIAWFHEEASKAIGDRPPSAVRTLAPSPCLTVEQIKECKEWLYGDV